MVSATFDKLQDFFVRADHRAASRRPGARFTGDTSCAALTSPRGLLASGAVGRSAAAVPTSEQGPALIRTGRALVNRRRAALVGLLGVGAALVVPVATLGQPSSIQGQQAQIAQLQNRLNGINYQATVAVNNYDGAMWHLQTARQQIAENSAAIKTDTAQLSRSETVLATRLREVYATPSPSAVQVLLSSGNITSVVDTTNLVQHIGSQDAKVVTGVRSTLGHLKTARVQLIAAQQTATQQVAAASQEKSKVLALLSQQQSVLSNAKANLRAAIAAQQAAAARAAAAQRAAAARQAALQAQVATQTQAATGGGGTAQTPITLPSGSGNAAAVAVAERYLGVPYVWGGESPSGFDCSGLVAYAYAQIGKSLPHYTVAQYDMFPKVPISQLQPGDIVFFYGLSHEAMYVGGGMIIQAPHTGAFVENTPLSAMGTPDGAVRP
jgi:cell wall-associated NlpC family hydrolase